MSNILLAVLTAAESNNLTQLKDALDTWSTQESPERAKALEQPMHSLQSALEIGLKLRHVDIANELLHRGCYIDRGIVLPLNYHSMLIRHWQMLC